jgi:hypothetical protein
MNCDPNCTQVAYSTNSTPVNGACSCLSGYVWVPPSSCEFDCSRVLNAVPTPSLTNNCTCNVGYLWNSVASTCDFNCSIFNFTIQGTAVNGVC